MFDYLCIGAYMVGLQAIAGAKIRAFLCIFGCRHTDAEKTDATLSDS